MKLRTLTLRLHSVARCSVYPHMRSPTEGWNKRSIASFIAGRCLMIYDGLWMNDEWFDVSRLFAFLNQPTFLFLFTAPTSSASSTTHSTIMPTIKDCSAPHCYNPGGQKCSGCEDASYCSKSCQATDWKFHKKTCYSAQNCNCFLLRAKGPEDASPTNVMAHVSAPGEFQRIASHC